MARRLRLRLLLAPLSVVIACVVGELVLRSHAPAYELLSSELFEPHSVYGHRPIPGARGRLVGPDYDVRVQHSEWGWRDLTGLSAAPARRRETRREASLETSRESTRLLVLGGAGVYGLGVEDDSTFAVRLRTWLPDWRIDACAAVGYGPLQQLAVLDHLGPELSPQVVLVVLELDDVFGETRAEPPAYGLTEGGRVGRSDGVLVATMPFDRATPHAADQPELPDSLLGHHLAGIVAAPDHSAWTTPRSRRTVMPSSPKPWQDLQSGIQLLQKRCRELGARLSICALPRTDGARRGDTPSFESRLGVLCGQLGIAWLPTSEAVQAAAAAVSVPMFRRSDGLPTPAGLQAFAAAVATALPVLLSD